MKKRYRLLSILLLCVLLLPTLASCALRGGMVQGMLDPNAYAPDGNLQNLSTATDQTDIRVMSFNIRGNLSSDTVKKARRTGAVIQEILSHSPALLGLQEDNKTWHNSYLLSALGDDGYKRIASNSVYASGEYCAIYYDPAVVGEPLESGSRYLTYTGTNTANALRFSDVTAAERAALNITSTATMRSTHTIYYYKPGDSTRYSESDAVLDVRLMSYGVFRVDGQTFLYVNTHLQHRSQTGNLATYVPEFLQLREKERMAQWNILQSYIAEIRGRYGDIPVVITGDMNDVPGSASYLHFIGAEESDSAVPYENASYVADIRRGPDGTWNAAYSKSGGDNPELLKNISITTDRTASSTLDYCFLSPNGWTVKQYQVGDGRVKYTETVDGTTSTGYVYTSDHRSIIIDLQLGASDEPMTLQLPGKETSPISVYSGTADTSWYTEDPDKTEYILTTADQLMGMINLRQSSKGAITFEGVTIRLGANMVFNELKDGVTTFTDPSDWKTKHEWTQLHSAYAFKGTFDGQGHYISGLYMPCGSGVKGMLGGLGGQVEVKNFALVNSYIQAPNASGKNTLGTVAAKTDNHTTATFYNLYSDCIIAEGNQLFYLCGGILGSAAGTNSKITMDHCTYAGAICVSGEKVGGLVGQVNDSTSTLTLTNCVNLGRLEGGNYTGGLVGYLRAADATLTNCANLGNLKALRMSGGLVGAIVSTPVFAISDCAVNANLDFSGIGEGGTEEDPVSVPEGCQVGGLIGKTYAITDIGYISGCTVAGTMKATKSIATAFPDDSTTEEQETDEYASGAILGFHALYSDNIKQTGKVLSYLRFDTILVSMTMIDTESYLGGTRNAPINSTHSKVSFSHILYDADKFDPNAMTLWGTRTDKDRTLDNSGEKNDQISNVHGYTTAELMTRNGKNDKVTTSGAAINYFPWTAAFYNWSAIDAAVMVRTPALKTCIDTALGLQDLRLIGYQSRVNAQNAALSDYRFVAVMEDFSLPAAGFVVTMTYEENGETVVRSHRSYCTNAYRLVQGGGITYTAQSYGGDYLYTITLSGVPNAVTNLRVEIQPFAAESVDGETILYDNYFVRTVVLNPAN
ncbi:MAG: endonuclease/exonuclease/phosphatase family protein [Clostridia bacterium]|nr:endonuclease/exonuclease/phosphatase family protein [Clostridia bacterium]